MPTLTIYGTNLSDTFLISDITYPGPYSEYIVFANEGDDTITVTGNLTAKIYSGAGNDLVFSGKGADQIWGGDGNDILNAGNGADTVYGGKGNDLLFGAGGNDYLNGGHGSDTIHGGSGDDFIFGNKGNNALFGGVGNDTINTGDHTSSANGGVGDDVMVARLKKGGDHILTGGDGADTFEFIYQNSRKNADVVITDFELGVDDFSINGEDGQAWVDTNFAFAETFGLDLLTEIDGNAVLDIGSKDTITFEGVSETEFLDYYEDSGLAIG